jgi:hypothetical protein
LDQTNSCFEVNPLRGCGRAQTQHVGQI